VETAYLFVAVLLLWPVSVLLGRAQWVARAPRLSIVTWFAVGANAAVAIVLFGFSMLPRRGGASVLQAIGALVVGRSPLHEWSVGTVVGLSVSGDLLVVGAALVVVAQWRLARERRSFRLLVDLVGEPLRNGAVAVAFDRPCAYFIPGDGGRVVLSTDLVAGAEPAVIDAVVGHEHGHGLGRHELLLLPFEALSSTLSFIPWVRLGQHRVAQAAEFLADDRAAHVAGTPAILDALRYFGRIRVAGPRCALAMHGAGTDVRIDRLTNPRSGRWGARWWLVANGCVAAAMTVTAIR